MIKLHTIIIATGSFIFTSYHGTPLRDLAIRKSYMKGDDICSLSNTSESMLRIPTTSKNKIQGLVKVFSFYFKFSRYRWDEIKIAEKIYLTRSAMFWKEI